MRILCFGVAAAVWFAGCSGGSKSHATVSPSPMESASTATPKPSVAVPTSSSVGGSGVSVGNGSRNSGQPTRTTIPSGTPGQELDSGKPSLSPAEWRKKNFKPRPFEDFEHLPGYQEVLGTRAVPSSRSSIERGRKIYASVCIYCHTADGKPVSKDPALLPYNMADLSKPSEYRYGSEVKSIFRSVAYGVDAPPMPGILNQYPNQDLWDLANFVYSLQK